VSNQHPPKSENPSEENKLDPFEKFLKDLNDTIFSGKPLPSIPHGRKV